MSNRINSIVTTMGIDIGKNAFHVVGLDQRGAIAHRPRVFPSSAREETRESRGMASLFLNTERVFGRKTTQKSGFRRHLAGSKMPKEGSKMPKETFLTAISGWRVVSRRALDASG